MPTNILMPALSPTMTEGKLAKWLVKEGDDVRAGDVVAEIETDKATMEVEAVDEGTVGRLVVAEGTEGVAVNSVIAVLVGGGESAEDAPAPKPPAGKPKEAAAEAASDEAGDEAEAESEAPEPSTKGRPETTPLAARMAAQAGIDLSGIAGSGPGGRITRDDVDAARGAEGKGRPAPEPGAGGKGGRVFASPLARRIARDNDLPLDAISGSGPRGRIVKADVETALKQGAARPKAEKLPAASPAAAPAADAGFDLVPHTSMRKVIARRLVEAKQTIPHFYLTVDCEIDELLRVRKEINARAPEGVKVSVNDLVIKAMAMALRRVPDANASWTEEGLRRYRSIDVSVAVAIKGGLITPIVRAADTKGLATIAKEMVDLAERARDGKLKPEEYQGGTISLSNLGMFGIKQFDAVINPPQACILAVGAGEPRPVVKDGQLAVATVMTCTLSCDHRVVDGALGAELLGAIKSLIEFPAAMLL